MVIAESRFSKVENGKFVVYNGANLLAELSESNKTGFNSDSDYVEVKKVNFVDESVDLFRRIDVPTGKTLSGYRFNNFGTPILIMNFEDVTMSVRLDSASSEDDLVIESGGIVDVVLLK